MILGLLHKHGTISDEMHVKAIESPLRMMSPKPPSSSGYTAFLELVDDRRAYWKGVRKTSDSVLNIVTSVDPIVQIRLLEAASQLEDQVMAAVFLNPLTGVISGYLEDPNASKKSLSVTAESFLPITVLEGLTGKGFGKGRFRPQKDEFMV